MNAQLMSLAFINALTNNVIIALGAISVFNWVSLTDRNSFIANHRAGVQTLIGFLYLGYLFIESLVNTYVDPRTTGVYWTALNMIVIAMFVLNLMTKSFSQVIMFAVLMWLYLILFARPVRMVGLFAYVLFDAELIFMQHYRHGIMAHRRFAYSTMLIFGLTCMVLVASMGNAAINDGLFWLRQVSALMILGFSALEYNRVLTKRERRAVVTAEEATHDGMTGLRNFAFFNKDLKREFATHKSDGHAYSLCEFDIDHFKDINDTYGHPKGNDVLRRVAFRLADEAVMLPYPARSYRLGGEEFCLVIEGQLNPVEEHMVADRVRSMISQLDLSGVACGLKITASVGITHVGDSDNNYLDVYTDVDKCLYNSKRAGRNSTTVRALMDAGEN
ncbi:GGDEF domain-containing protein [Lacticaseibacillus zhaodongensis]|uniref:GGDEF domain-containing protein n=1 Tax=Lacticaseibacillus zhaodongensis TaxID=2668065 RepID=UPI0012D2BEC2|nr:GGDEF domain-containing protein [Lacticaseibacillus zhaodongensis]